MNSSIRPQGYDLFSCSTVQEISTAHKKTKISTNEEVSCFGSLRCCIYHADKCLIANNCWHFNIYEQNKFRAQLSCACKKYYNLGAWFDTRAWHGMVNCV